MNLRTDNLCKRFDGAFALKNVSVEFLAGRLTALVGGNGAGKSTLFNLVAGLDRPDAGEVYLGTNPAQRITGLSSHLVARHGIGILFQDVRVFSDLTVLDNVAVGVPDQIGERSLATFLQPGRCAAREREVIARAREALNFVGLECQQAARGGTLSYGQQKLVALARLLASDASVLLLDEPTSGIHPDRVSHMLNLIRALATNHRRTVVMIEHNFEVVRQVSDYVYSLNRGEVVCHGTPTEVLAS